MRICLRITGLLTFIVLLTSCSEDIIEPLEGTHENYSQLIVGNYWVYDKYAIDTFGVETALNSYDSVYIEKDTLINGYTYFKIVEPAVTITVPYYYSIPKKINFLRDSADCIVTSEHRTIFSSENFNSSLYVYYHIVGADTSYKETATMTDLNVNFSVPAGNFVTTTVHREIVSYAAWAVIFGSVFTFRTRYAENVGIITMDLPLVPGQVARFERRLVRYHLQ